MTAAEMMDPLSSADLALKAAEEFFDLARKAPTPFMRAYYERVALRYLTSEGGLALRNGIIDRRAIWRIGSTEIPADERLIFRDRHRRRAKFKQKKLHALRKR